jgi:uncharacterized membrane protein YdjX (TVP38/TMEM64 family)
MDRAVARQIGGVATLLVVAGLAAMTLSPAGLAAAVARIADRPLQLGAVLVAGYGLRFLAAWPISGLSIVVGFTLGPFGVPVALAGAVLTCLPPFLLARRTDGGPLGTFGDHGRRYFTATGDLRGVVATRLAPLPADPVSYTAGLAGVRPGAYALGTALGEFPWVIAAVLVGASLDELTTRGFTASPALVVGATALALLLLSGPLYRLLQARGVGPALRR